MVTSDSRTETAAPYTSDEEDSLDFNPGTCPFGTQSSATYISIARPRDALKLDNSRDPKVCQKRFLVDDDAAYKTDGAAGSSDPHIGNEQHCPTRNRGSCTERLEVVVGAVLDFRALIALVSDYWFDVYLDKNDRFVSITKFVFTPVSSPTPHPHLAVTGAGRERAGFQEAEFYKPHMPKDRSGLEFIPDEQRLLDYVMRGYERSVRPVKNASSPVVIQMGLTLTQVLDMVRK
ncbi:acetylcholine receptor protein alpha [Elysia marginata]|uniref:Acetylcholine receptor protein alpha n=1 Tax=Elysia marginata TaxID=1093978 RepID=A0AAV4GWS2_9GAST|nr:acetylcholine receptor protein alpha [Elysia marginata]